MRAINTTTLQFRDDLAYGDGSYAILSHRWEDDEVSYQDYLEGHKRDSVGYAKIMNFCELARLRGHEWAWVWSFLAQCKADRAVCTVLPPRFRRR